MSRAGLHEWWERQKLENALAAAAAERPRERPQGLEDAVYAACQRKTAYRSEAAAGRAARVGERNGVKLWIYRCQFCNNFHLSKKSPAQHAGVEGPS